MRIGCHRAIVRTGRVDRARGGPQAWHPASPGPPAGRALDSPLVSHPSLGLPPRDVRKGHPAGAARLRENVGRLGVRALELAIDRDPTIRERHDELALRKLLRDTEVWLERLALSVAGDDVHWMQDFADATTVPYRRRGVPMDDVIHLLEGIRAASRSVLTLADQRAADAAIDAAIRNLRWHRRLAGDARRRNPILAAIYKGG